jgi:flagellar basal-body rod protein FlgF
MDNTSSIVLSRLMAQQRALDVTATNIANTATPGFRAGRMVFSDWLARTGTGSDQAVFTQDRATYRDPQRGTLTPTGNKLDIALGAEGYFAVQTPQGVRLTRAGHFELSAQGAIVDAEGNNLLDTIGRPLQVATADTDLTIASDGTVSSQNGRIGRIGVVTPTTPSDLKAEGGRLFSAGGPTAPVAAPSLVQGAIEASNVQPTQELTRMMNDLREFQFTSEMVQAEADRQQGAIDKIIQKRS